MYEHAETIEGKCQYCGKTFIDYASNYKRSAKKYCSQECYHAATRKDTVVHCEWCGKEFIRTSKSPQKRFCTVECACAWKRSRPRRVTKSKNGYRYIWLSDGTSKPEHIQIMEEKIGRKLHKDECVHHIDGNRSNNSPDNLMLMKRGEHSSLHRKKEIKDGKMLFGRVS